MAKFNKPKKDKFDGIFPPFRVVSDLGVETTIHLGEVLDELQAGIDDEDDFEYDDYDDDWLDDGWLDETPMDPYDHEAAAKERAIRELEELGKRFSREEDE